MWYTYDNKTTQKNEEVSFSITGQDYATQKVYCWNYE